MTETPAAYRAAVRARHRTDALERIADRIAAGHLADLPDVFLIIIERAMDRDMIGIYDFARHPGYRAFPTPTELAP